MKINRIWQINFKLLFILIQNKNYNGFYVHSENERKYLNGKSFLNINKIFLITYFY